MTASSLYPRTTAVRRLQSLDGTWDFQFDPKGEGETAGWPSLGLPDPIDMPVPASFADIFTDKESREYAGDVWYAKRVFVPGEWRGMRVEARFDAATHRATVYLNGRQVAEHEGGFTPFAARLDDGDDAIRWNDWNLLAVKVNNELSLTSLPLGRTVERKHGAKRVRPFFDFFNYSGLQRSVRLVATPKTRIEDLSIVTAGIEGAAGSRATARVRYQVEVTGGALPSGCAVELAVADAAGAVVARAEGLSGELSIGGAHLWGLHDGYLYTFTARIVDASGSVVDEYYDEVGLRTVEVSGARILLNGRPVYLKGFGRHEDCPIHGRGFDPVFARRDFELMKWIGANSFRTSHYPYAEEELQEADREGFFVIDEVAAVGMLVSTTNFTDATKEATGVTLFSEPGVAAGMLAVHRRAVQELIARDKNHACVCAWSLFNEPDFSEDAAVPYCQEIFDLARELDPQGRPCSYTNVTRCRGTKDKCIQIPDFIMLNRYDGWYVKPGIEIDEARELLADELDTLGSSLRPDTPVVFTEYGCDTQPGLHKLPSIMWSEEYQVEFFQMMHELFDSHDWIVGEQPWNLADFQTEEGMMRVDGNKKGAFTRDRQPKAVAHLLRERWTGKPDYLTGSAPARPADALRGVPRSPARSFGRGRGDASPLFRARSRGASARGVSYNWLVRSTSRGTQP